MNYFLKISSKPNLPLVFDKNNPVNGSILALGKYIKDGLNTILIYNDAENSDVTPEKLLTYDVLETVGGGLLISQRFSDVLISHFGNEIQLFETKFTYKNIECISYKVLNIYNKVECYDMTQSVYTKHPVDGSYTFSKVVLDKNPIEEYGYRYNIVRSIHDNRIVVSEEFKDIVKNNNINSIGFTQK